MWWFYGMLFADMDMGTPGLSACISSFNNMHFLSSKLLPEQFQDLNVPRHRSVSWTSFQCAADREKLLLNAYRRFAALIGHTHIPVKSGQSQLPWHPTLANWQCQEKLKLDGSCSKTAIRTWIKQLLTFAWAIPIAAANRNFQDILWLCIYTRTKGNTV